MTIQETEFIKNKRLEFYYDICLQARDLQSKYISSFNTSLVTTSGVKYNIEDDETFADIKSLALKVNASIFKNKMYIKALDHLLDCLTDIDFKRNGKNQYGKVIEVILEIVIEESCNHLGLKYESMKEFKSRHSAHTFDEVQQLFTRFKNDFAD